MVNKNKLVKKIKTFGVFVLVAILSVMTACVVLGALPHGTADRWITQGMLDNTPPEDYGINQSTQAKAKEGKYNKYFLKEALQEVHITLDENNLNYLLQNAKDEPYVMTDNVTIGDTTIGYCGLKTKGDFTLQHSYDDNVGSDRFSFTVHFGKYINKSGYGEKQTFYGCEKISFNNLFFDKSMLKEFLAYKLLDEMGLPIPQYGLAKLYINGEYYGVYFMVEAMEETILEQYYNVKDVDGYLDKPKFTTLQYKDILENPAAMFGGDLEELEENEDILPIIQEWSRKLTYLSEGKDFEGGSLDVNSEKYLELLSQVMNVDEAVRYFAVHSWLCQTDSMFEWMKNYGLYISEDGVSTIVPWDYDLSFGGYGDHTAETAANYALDIMYAPNYGADVADTPEKLYAEFPLFQVIYQNEHLMEQYYTYMGECSQIAALGGTVQSTGKTYEPVYFNSCIGKLEASLYEAAEEELADHVYYMNGADQPEDIKEAIPHLKKFVAMRAVGVKLQLENADSRVCGAGCKLYKIGTGLSGNSSIGGRLTVVDGHTGIYVTAEYEQVGSSPVLTVHELEESDNRYTQIKQALNFTDFDLGVFQMEINKKSMSSYELTIPVIPELLQDEIVFYTYSDGMLTKFNMEQKGNLFTGMTESIEYIVVGHSMAEKNSLTSEKNIVVIILILLMVVMGIGSYILILKGKKRLAMMNLLLVCICLVVLMVVVSRPDDKKEIIGEEAVSVELITQAEEPTEYKSEKLSGKGWWQAHDISEDYVLTGDGYITLDICGAGANDLENSGFCVEIYDEDGHYITTTSQGDAWFAGTDGTLTGMKEAPPIVPGSTIRVLITREGNHYTLEYCDKKSGEQLLHFVAEENGMFSDTVKLRIMAQVGDFEVKVLEIKQGGSVHEP